MPTSRPAATRRSGHWQWRVHGRGQLRFFLADGHTYLEANTTDATAGAEMAIRLEMQVTPHAADFVL